MDSSPRASPAPTSSAGKLLSGKKRRVTRREFQRKKASVSSASASATATSRWSPAASLDPAEDRPCPSPTPSSTTASVKGMWPYSHASMRPTRCSTRAPSSGNARA
ncbi:hypothetical protein DEMA109039_10875 [Deinococcus marmoris]